MCGDKLGIGYRQVHHRVAEQVELGNRQRMGGVAGFMLEGSHTGSEEGCAGTLAGQHMAVEGFCQNIGGGQPSAAIHTAEGRARATDEYHRQRTQSRQHHAVLLRETDEASAVAGLREEDIRPLGEGYECRREGMTEASALTHLLPVVMVGTHVARPVQVEEYIARIGVEEGVHIFLVELDGGGEENAPAEQNRFGHIARVVGEETRLRQRVGDDLGDLLPVRVALAVGVP